MDFNKMNSLHYLPSGINKKPAKVQPTNSHEIILCKNILQNSLHHISYYKYQYSRETWVAKSSLLRAWANLECRQKKKNLNKKTETESSNQLIHD